VAGFMDSVIVGPRGVLVVCRLPISICCALFLSTFQGRGKTLFVFVNGCPPIITPGVIVGISTLYLLERAVQLWWLCF